MPLRLLRRLALCGGAMAAAVTLTSCTSSRASSNGPLADEAQAPAAAIDTVAVIGDSLTDGAHDTIRAAMQEAGYDPVLIDGVPSRRSTVGGDGGPTSGLSAVNDAVASGVQPDAWVIALGTNDVPQYASSDDYAAVVAELTAAVPDGAPLAWVGTYLRDAESQSAAFNQVLHTQLDFRPSTVVVDWAERATGDGVLSEDGIHPTVDGYDAFAATIVEGVTTLDADS